MPTYRVIFAVDIQANSTIEAALGADEIMQGDPENHFITVKNLDEENSEPVMFDLNCETQVRHIIANDPYAQPRH